MRFNWQQVEKSRYNTYTKFERDATFFRLGRSNQKMFAWLLLGPNAKAWGSLGLMINRSWIEMHTLFISQTLICTRQCSTKTFLTHCGLMIRYFYH